nr:N-acetylmuramoyl-L-alanine amidase [Apibacter mensalis]
MDLANDNKADYFISIHADGVAGYKASGSHVIYPNVGNDEVIRLSKELAVDIFSSYDIVEVEKNSPKQDIRGLQVLGKSNKTKRKVLIELGFVTSPKDAKLLFTKIDEISVQIRDGLLKNLKKF